MCYTKEKMVVKKNDGDWRTSDNSQGTATDNRAIEAQQTTSSDDYEKPSPQSQHKKPEVRLDTKVIIWHLTIRSVLSIIYPQHCASLPNRDNCTNLKIHDTCYAVDIIVKKPSNIRLWSAIAEVCKKLQNVLPISAVQLHMKIAWKHWYVFWAHMEWLQWRNFVRSSTVWQASNQASEPFLICFTVQLLWQNL